MSSRRPHVVSRLSHGPSDSWLPRDAPWWRELPVDFHRHREDFALEEHDRWPVALTSASDGLIRTFASTLLAGTALPLGFAPWQLSSLKRDLEFYGEILDSGDRERMFATPSGRVEVTTSPARRPLYRPSDGECLDVRFTSPFVPVQPSLRGPYERKRRNATVSARWWRQRNGPRPTIIAIHGFSADLYQVNEWFFSLPFLYRMGADVLLFTLPFHGSRQSMLSPFSGHGFFSGGVGRMNEAFAQAVFDLRVLMDHLFAEGVEQIGVTGVSLGGFTTALLASVDPRLSFAIPNVPVASLPDLVLEWTPMGTAIRGMMGAAGLSLEDVRRGCAPTCPLTWDPLVPRDRRMLIGGVADRLAPPKHTKLLWDHWDHCRLHWFPGSHLLHLDRGDYLWQIARFLRKVGFLDPDHPRDPTEEHPFA
ncbi:MAG: alpha/beta hydrolase family protein [Myxococcales bacterium]|nr:alpha/beta hydrolase family protein [Myxococcales bacterium]